MKFSFSMTEEEKLQYEEYYNTVTLVWQTSFKNGFVSDMENGFNAVNFIGTGKEYYKTLEEFEGSDDKGKVIGSHSYTLDEWADKTRVVPSIIGKEKLKELTAKFEQEYEANRARRNKINKTKRD